MSARPSRSNACSSFLLQQANSHLEKDSVLEIEGRLWLKKEGKNFLGSGRIELLEQIRREGSISKAAKAMKMSYKAAWDMVDAMNNLSDEPVVERMAGGKHGGGTRLTAEGAELIRAFRELDSFYKTLLEISGEEGDSLKERLELLKKMQMKSSAKNLFYGKVSAIRRGSVNSRLDLGISKTGQLHAVITTDALADMGLQVGSDAFAMFKESAVMLASQRPEGLSASNILEGEIVRLEQGAVNAEVKLQLEKNSIFSVITNEACTELGLAVGRRAYAVIKASDIIIGV